MQFVCFLMVVAGLFICFGGISFRKLCAAVSGFVSGTIAAIFIMLLLSGKTNMDGDGTLTAILIFSVISAWISYAYEKICDFINSFFPLTLIITVLLLVTVGSDDGDLASMIFVASILAAIASGICVVFYDYSFMLETAFVGAFIASLGFAGLLDGSRNFSDLLWLIFDSDNALGGILAGTFFIGIFGFCTQLYRFNTMQYKQADAAENKEIPRDKSNSWQCSCGTYNATAVLYCSHCGASKNDAIRVFDEAADTWTCSCGKTNSRDYRCCTACGQVKYSREEKSDSMVESSRYQPISRTESASPQYCTDSQRLKVPKPAIVENGSIICPNCLKKQPSNLKICINCGQVFMNNHPQIEYWCGKCGYVGPYDNCCPSCGSSVKIMNTDVNMTK